MIEPTIWGIHAGATGDAHTLFLKKKVVALGWNKVGDLSTLAPNRDNFKTAVSLAYPETNPGAIPINAGQLFRFIHEMKPEDLVLYPPKQDKKIHN
jgi:restriction system protein